MLVEQTSATIDMSPDGYVRLTLARFLTLAFDDRARWMDEDLLEDLRAENLTITRAGFCEWQSGAASTAVSLGWTWYEAADEVHITSDGISSNLMFLDSQGRDLGPRKTQSLLKAWLSLQSWSAVTAAASVAQALSTPHAAKVP